MRARSVDAVRRDPAADLEQHVRLGAGTHVAVHEHALRTLGRVLAVVLNIDRARGDIDAHNLAEVVIVERQASAVAFANVVVLGRDRVRVPPSVATNVRPASADRSVS